MIVVVDPIEQLRAQHDELERLGAELEAMDAEQDRLDAAVEQTADPAERHRLRLEAQRSRAAHLTAKSINVLMRRTVSLQAAVLQLAERLERLEQRPPA